MIKTIEFKCNVIKFHEDVNVIIGSNGSGKTSLIELIAETLNEEDYYCFYNSIVTKYWINYLLKSFDNQESKCEDTIDINDINVKEDILKFKEQLKNVLNQYFPTNKLSKGIYQYLSLLLNLYLNRNKKVIFIDDIELYLDIDQQRSLIGLLKEQIIPNSQLICTTNSLLLVDIWCNKVIDLNKLKG